MGLDMYLKAGIYISEYSDKELFEKVNSGVIESLADFKIQEVKAEAMYWRKANQIHNWFVQNVQNGTDDCGHYYVSIEQLKELRDTCQRVLDDHSLAETLLPSKSGFFFGGTDYDDYYYEDLKYTVKGIDKILAVKDRKFDLEYHSSW